MLVVGEYDYVSSAFQTLNLRTQRIRFSDMCGVVGKATAQELAEGKHELLWIIPPSARGGRNHRQGRARWNEVQRLIRVARRCGKPVGVFGVRRLAKPETGPLAGLVADRTLLLSSHDWCAYHVHPTTTTKQHTQRI